MKRLDKFILKAFVGPFFAILLVVIFILMMQFLWLYIDELVGKGLSLRVIGEFLLWGVCTILPLALPLTTLLASVMTLGNFGENNELLAIRSAGIPLTRVMAPMIGAAFLISVGAFFIGDSLVPRAFNEIYTLRDDIGRTKDEISIPAGIFYEGIDGYVLKTGSKNPKTGMMYDVMVYNHTNHNGNTSVSIADSAILRLSANKDYLTFSMFDGCNYQEENKTGGYKDDVYKLQRIYFKSQEMVIPLENYSFQQSDSVRFDDQIKAMKFSQLKELYDSCSVRIDSLRPIAVKRLVSTNSLKYSYQLDTARKDIGKEVFQADNFLEWEKPEDAVRAARLALDKLRSAKVNAEEYYINSYSDLFFYRGSYIEMLKMFAQALACLLLFFIGAPLGALISKGGLGASAIVAALFFVLYWVIDISGTRLANNGAVNGFIGIFISAMIMAPIGAYLTWKATHDATTLRLDAFKDWWAGLRSLIRQFFKPVRIVFMGTPEFAVESLDSLVKGKYKVVAVVTAADKPSGRGLKINESAVKRYAVEHGIPVLQPLKLKDPEFLAQLKGFKADLFVVVAFRMLPREVWSMPRLGTFNLHAALLPQYRGAAPINWAVINGERYTGVTTFMIDDNIDTGNIMLRERCAIGPGETAGDVHDKLMKMGAELTLQTVDGLVRGGISLHVQKEYIQGEEVLRPAPKLTVENCRIDWSRDTESIYNLVRGLSPFPTAWTTIAGKDGGESVQLKIFFGEKSERRGTPGQILSDGKNFLAVCTGDGALELKELQLAGKKRMDVKSFLAGFREPQNYKAV